ncbi:hypothetical protein VIGAN_07009700 [Vigna angularis var. angularis]|uniref:Uncharacterized protein n=1 Tax=Vigna angularis var. angularis TaxID=157739 RepID=A0A0S3SF99_PHAAN|nr:hypothetical protein VIGAN_07009700 [Vigna angularis var. angularis]
MSDSPSSPVKRDASNAPSSNDSVFIIVSFPSLSFVAVKGSTCMILYSRNSSLRPSSTNLVQYSAFSPNILAKVDSTNFILYLGSMATAAARMMQLSLQY